MVVFYTLREAHEKGDWKRNYKREVKKKFLEGYRNHESEFENARLKAIEYLFHCWGLCELKLILALNNELGLVIFLAAHFCRNLKTKAVGMRSIKFLAEIR